MDEREVRDRKENWKETGSQVERERKDNAGNPDGEKQKRMKEWGEKLRNMQGWREEKKWRRKKRTGGALSSVIHHASLS